MTEMSRAMYESTMVFTIVSLDSDRIDRSIYIVQGEVALWCDVCGFGEKFNLLGGIFQGAVSLCFLL